MNLNAVTNQSSALTQLYGTQSTSAVSQLDISKLLGTNTTNATSSADTVDVSKPAELFNKLQQLQQSDPDKFKQVCSDIAQQLKDAAQTQTGPAAERLSKMADKFQNVADGGDISQLQPPAHHGGHHFSGGGSGISAYTQQSDQSMLDLLNSNQTNGQQSSMANLMNNILQEVQKAIAS